MCFHELAIVRKAVYGTNFQMMRLIISEWVEQLDNVAEMTLDWVLKDIKKAVKQIHLLEEYKVPRIYGGPKFSQESCYGKENIKPSEAYGCPKLRRLAGINGSDGVGKGFELDDSSNLGLSAEEKNFVKIMNSFLSSKKILDRQLAKTHEKVLEERKRAMRQRQKVERRAAKAKKRHRMELKTLRLAAQPGDRRVKQESKGDGFSVSEF